MQELEQILSGEDSNESFYRDPQYRDWKLDEEKLPELNGEELTVVRFVAEHSFTGGKTPWLKRGTYYHSSQFGDVVPIYLITGKKMIQKN